MSRKGILYDLLAPAWAALTPEQRVCWHFTALRNPSLNAAGYLSTENGWQWFVDLNSELFVIDELLMLADPPTDNTPPEPQTIDVNTWPLPVQLPAGSSTRNLPPSMSTRNAWRPNTAAIATQTYDRFAGPHERTTVEPRITGILGEQTVYLTGANPTGYITYDGYELPPGRTTTTNNAPRVRHVTTIQAGDDGDIALTNPTGYYATTDGENRFATIKGRTARRRPDLPLGRLRQINTTNGQIIRTTIPNPTGGSPSIISRPRHYP